MCDKGLIRNPSNCVIECYKSCDFSKYLDYKNCKCRKKLVDKLVDECTGNVEEVKIAKITLAKHKSRGKCNSCTLCIVLFSALLTIKVRIGTYFVCFHWFKKNIVDLTETTIY